MMLLVSQAHALQRCRHSEKNHKLNMALYIYTYGHSDNGYVSVLKTQTVFTNADFLRAGFVFFETMRSQKIFPNNLSSVCQLSLTSLPHRKFLPFSHRNRTY